MRWRLGEGRAVGLFALLVAIVTYASPVSERMLWRWSYVDAGILGVVLLLFGGTLLELLQPATGPIDAGHSAPGSRAAVYWVDLGWALWGIGYLIGSAFVPATRGRLFRLDLTGSVIPGASLLEWGGIVAVLVAVAILVWRRIGRRSWLLALLITLPLLALAGGETWARWEALYRPRATPLPSLAQARWDRVHVARNEEGFRDAPHDTAPAAGTSRLLLVGGEGAYGTGIGDTGARVSELLAVRLSAATHHRWESLNAGRLGTNTKDQLAILRAALPWHPAAVVLLYEFDDIDYFAPVARKELLAEPAIGWPARLHPLRLLYLNSVLVQEGFLRLRAEHPDLVGAGLLAHDPYGDSSLVAAHLEDLQALVQAATEGGAVPLVVPLDVSVVSDATHLVRYRTFVAALAGAGIPVIGVDSVLAGHPAGRLEVGGLDHAPNELADRLVAGEVARRLLVLLKPSGGAGTTP
ncbi:MAG: hypothetical protein JF590_03480 [Gemmatimonadetes bacterium]|nr:hypothetical protein [Gemmatimonadota bacterium]